MCGEKTVLSCVYQQGEYLITPAVTGILLWFTCLLLKWLLLFRPVRPVPPQILLWQLLMYSDRAGVRRGKHIINTQYYTYMCEVIIARDIGLLHCTRTKGSDRYIDG